MAWDRLTSFIAGGAVSRAVGPTMDAKFEPARQNAWMRRRHRVLLAELAAQARARYAAETLTFASTGQAPGGPAESSWGGTAVDLADDAARGGWSPARYNLFTRLAQRVPGFGTALELLKRGLIDADTFEAMQKHEGLPPGLLNALRGLRYDPLTPADVANAVQQGFLPNDGLLPAPEAGGPPFEPAVERVDLDPTGQAAAGGVSPEHLRVLAQLAGNPPGPMELLTLWNRGLITEQAVEQGIREGRTKTKWTPALKQLRHAVLSAAEYAGLHLRGWISEQQMNAGGELTGYSAEQMNLLYLNRGRPVAPVQAFTAFFRGAPGPYGGTFGKDDFLRALKQSDVRTEYGETLWAIRHAYPSLFQLNRLVQAGAATPAQAGEWARFNRLAPDVVAALEQYWRQPAAGSAGDLTAAEWAADFEGGYITEAQYRAHLAGIGYAADAVEAKVRLGDTRKVRAARNQAVGRIRLQYVGHRIKRDRAVELLQRTAVRPEARELLLASWDLERDANTAALTPATIRAAYRKTVLTRARAVELLLEKGYSDEDAATFLAA